MHRHLIVCIAVLPALPASAADEIPAPEGRKMEADDLLLVPEPWTPIVSRGHSVECWNRVYDLGEGLLPQRITTGGADLLAGPMRLLVKEAGLKQAGWSGSVQEWTGVRYEVTKSQADVIGTIAQAESNLLRVTCRYRFEFDGMLLCDLQIEPRVEPVTAPHCTTPSACCTTWCP